MKIFKPDHLMAVPTLPTCPALASPIPSREPLSSGSQARESVVLILVFLAYPTFDFPANLISSIFKIYAEDSFHSCHLAQGHQSQDKVSQLN